MKRTKSESDRENASQSTRPTGNQRETASSNAQADLVPLLHRAVGNQAVHSFVRDERRFSSESANDDGERVTERSVPKSGVRGRRSEGGAGAGPVEERSSEPTSDMCPRCVRRYWASKPLNCAECERSLGNTGADQTLQRSMDREAIQPKLKIGDPNDRYEREAEQVAHRVVNTEESEQPVDAVAESRRKRTGGGVSAVDGRSERRIRSLKGSGRSLSEAERSFFEPQFGRSFDDVRIYTGKQAAKLNDALNARAFTYGQNIYFGPGNYRPETPAGRKLLAHELTHVVQQTGDGLTLQAQTQVQRLGDQSQVPSGFTCPVARDSPSPAHMVFQFQIESSTLHPDDFAAIETLIDNWHAAGANEDIRLDGYASPDGPEPLNWTLSCDRAMAVKNALMRSTSKNPGIPASHIEVFAHGETSEFSPANPPNRRATLRLEGGPPVSESMPTPDRVVPCTTTPMQIFSRGGCGTGSDFTYNDFPSLSGVGRYGRMLVWQADNLSTDFRLRNDMRTELGLLAGSEGLRMVNHFASGSGTKLTHGNTSTLGQDALSSGTFSRLHRSVVQDIERQLTGMATSGVIDCNNTALSGGRVPSVAFDFSDSSALKGIIGGTQGLRIRITHFSVTPGTRSYDIGIQYLICDDFGVDTSDLYSPGLAAFWVLQHRRSGYRPFINELDLSVTAAGTY